MVDVSKKERNKIATFSAKEETFPLDYKLESGCIKTKKCVFRFTSLDSNLKSTQLFFF